LLDELEVSHVNHTKTWVVLNDLQIPFHDKPVLDLVLNFVNYLQPHGVVLNGDVVDCYDISAYTRDPLHRANLNTEVKLAGQLMSRLAKCTKERWWLGGNHEDRLRRYVWQNAPQLGLLPDTTFPSLFKIAEHGFQWKPWGGSVKLGRLIVTHGFVVRVHSAYSAKAHFDRLGSSVIVGHTHRLGVYYNTNSSGTHASFENGCLCKLTGLGYSQFPNWQQGFSVVHVGEGGFFNVVPVPILNRKVFFYGGEKWER
jgi:predicted phosphodiesterase